MKKFISILLVLLLIGQSFTTVFAAESGDAIIAVSDVTAAAGETVDVPIVISNNPGITALSFDISYDSSKLSLISVTDGKILGTSTPSFGNDMTLIPYTLCWDDLSTTDNYGNGTVATLKFAVKEDASGTADITITLKQGSTFNVDMEDVYFKTVNGSVAIGNAGTETEEPAITVSDVTSFAGETIEVPIVISNNPGITALSFDVSYDSSKLSLVSATDGKILGTSTPSFGNDMTLIPYTLCWDDLSTTDNYGNGTVATLKFKVKENAVGTADITIALNQGSTFNVDMEDVYFKTVNGSIVIEEQKVMETGISVKRLPVRTGYYRGEELNETGLELDLLYSDGTSKTISWGFTCSPKVLNTAGTQKITVTYHGFTASFDVNVYEIRVSFDANGGTNAPDLQVKTLGVALKLSSDKPIRNGYTFVGWNTQADGNGVTYAPGATYTEDTARTLYAQWKLDTYTISYTLNGGSVSTANPTSYNVTTAAFTLNNPTRAGYTFAGWTGTGLSAATKTVTVAKGSTGERAYTANWTANAYTVTFDANGGTTSTASKNVTYDSTYGTLPTPTRTGYTFNGWYTEKTGGTKITADTKVAITSAQTLYAQWSGDTYTVRYDANGGTGAPEAQTGSYGSPLVLSTETPVYGSVTFIGWNTEADGSGTTYMPGALYSGNESVTLYAQWNMPKYTVTFIPNGGTCSPTSKTVIYGSAYGELPVAERSGYTFNGWFTLPSGGTQITSETTVEITENIYLYAQWTAAEYTVTFDANGGECDIESKTVTYRTLYGALPVPTRNGYDFIGWYTAKEGGTKITSDTRVTITSDTVLYAQWRIASYHITFDANGGICSVMSKTVTYSSTYGELPVPERTGYTFDGWFTSATGGTQIIETSTVINEQPHTLYAHWTIEHYKLNLYGNGYGYSHTTGIDYTETYAEALGENLPELTRTGYVFEGWFTESVGGTKVTSDMKCIVAADHALYAHWTPVSVIVSFDAMGGECSEEPRTLSYDSTYGELPVTSKPGYIFNGWFTAESGGSKIEADSVVKTAADHTLYAQWQAKSYWVYYNAGYGSGAPDAQKKPYDIDLVLSSTVPKRSGYEFTGWNTSQDGTGTSYAPGDIYKENKELYLYAQWERLAQYYVYYDANGGTAAPSYQKKDEGVPLVLRDTEPTRAGYVFMEWNTEKDGSGDFYDPGTVYIYDADVTLYAQWHPISYTVTFDPNGGKCDTFTKTVTYGEPYGELPEPTREGYIFKGWHMSYDYVYPFILVETAEDHVLKAIWVESGDGHNLYYDYNYDNINVNLFNYQNSNGPASSYTRYNRENDSLIINTSSKGEYKDYSFYSLLFNPEAGVYKITAEVLGGSVNNDCLIIEAMGFDNERHYIEIGNQSTSATWVINEAQVADIYSIVVWVDHDGSENEVRFNNLELRIKLEKVDSVNTSPTAYSKPYDEYGFSSTNIYKPTREGYIFTGWYTEPVGGEIVNSVSVKGNTQTVYAHWEKELELKDISPLYTIKVYDLIFGPELFDMTAEELSDQFVNENIVVVPSNDKKLGTGTEVRLIDERGEVCQTVYVVIFGDINGDGWYDAEDAVIVDLIIHGYIDEVPLPYGMAVECNYDGELNEEDVLLLERAGLLLAEVMQSPEGYADKKSEAYAAYISLIDQSAGLTVEKLPEIIPDEPQNSDMEELEDEKNTDSSVKTPENTTDTEQSTESEDEIETLIMNIFDFIKKIFAIIFSFIIK